MLIFREMTNKFDVLIIGGGAGGFFSAINIAEKHKNKKIAILEKSKEPLQKVKISGGGRCNVTNSQTNISELVKNYPRGEKELKSVFHRFSTQNTIQWFENKGVKLKTEPDGRVFPASNSSQEIIDCFLKEVEKHKISVFYKENVQNIQQKDDFWQVSTQNEIFYAEKLIISTGSNPKMWDILKNLGHQIIEPVPSLFTFNTDDIFVTSLQGISLLCKAYLVDNQGEVIKDKQNKPLDRKGILAPILFTHWGFSAPCVLKLSAYGARGLHYLNYDFILRVNWAILNEKALNEQEVFDFLLKKKEENSAKKLQNTTIFDFPKRFWLSVLERLNIDSNLLWSHLSKANLQKMALFLTKSEFKINGKSTFKEEFVTAGGVCLKEIDFKSFESKKFKNLYFTGEVLDIDAITGGFNFQNAWSGGYIVSEEIF